ncbi:unnamed protein product [Phytomonas sp. Hart1]|nr:unnamed protein product [Phytomonas sp. Hart1]|eukprot:CCW68435.1 unnamed protein product [Phytomonas sp. isolate Hart1]
MTLPLLCEFLRLGTLNSRELAYWCFQHHRQQPSSDPNTEASQQATEEEIQAFLDSVQGLLAGLHEDPSGATNRSPLEEKAREVNLLLSPSLPLRRCAGVGEEEYVLHQAVMQEFAAVRILAKLRFARSTKRPSDGARGAVSFSLALQVPEGMANRDLHLEAIREMTMGLRDGFLYVLRRMHYPHTIFIGPDRGYEPVLAPMASEAERAPDDEYEVVKAEAPDPVSSMLPVREVRRRERHLHKLRRRLNANGITIDEAPSNDWMWTLPYARRGR